MNWLKWA